MSETNQIIHPSQPSQSTPSQSPPTAAQLRRQKREEARLAQAQRVTKVAGTRQTITVYEGDPGTYRDPDPANTRGWTFVTRSYRTRTRAVDL